MLETIGWTPLIRLNRVTRGIRTPVYGKAEFFNPGGSVKDRIGLPIIEQAEREGRLKPGGTIVEGTSGNTGVGLAIAAALKGYKCIFTMPDKMSQEKVRLLKAFGAEVIITPTAVPPDHPDNYVMMAKRIAEETPNAILANQFYNDANPEAHYATTGPELWEQTEGRIALVAERDGRRSGGRSRQAAASARPSGRRGRRSTGPRRAPPRQTRGERGRPAAGRFPRVLQLDELGVGAEAAARGVDLGELAVDRYDAAGRPAVVATHGRSCPAPATRPSRARDHVAPWWRSAARSGTGGGGAGADAGGVAPPPVGPERAAPARCSVVSVVRPCAAAAGAS